MKTLVECWEYTHNNIAESDKGTVHTFLPFYDHLFKEKRKKDIVLLEIGVKKGGSLAMWQEYFSDGSVICGIDQKKPKIELPNVLIGNAYDLKTVKKVPTRLDIIIDDGSHTLKDMQFVLKYYLPLLENDGILIIEDIPKTDFIKTLHKTIPNEYKQYSYFVDRRHVRPRGDDLILVINKEI